MKPPGMWGPNEFSQFTQDELHETMMGAAPGSNYFEWAKAELEHRDRRRSNVQHDALQVLQTLYDRTRNQTTPVFVTELGIGLNEEESRAVWRYLKDKGLIQTFSLDYSARINAAGIDAIENARLPLGGALPRVSSVTHNVVNIGTAIHSPIQQAGNHSVQSQATGGGADEVAMLVRLVEEFTRRLSELKLDVRQTQKATAQIDTLRAQLADEPDPVIVRQAGRTLRNVTEGAVASLIASAAQPTVWHWVSQAMATLFPK